MIIRPLLPADLPAISALEQSGIQGAWSPEMLRGELEIAQALQLVALGGNELIGYLASRIIPPEAELLRLVISPAQRRRGFGGKLMESFFTRLALLQITECYLEARRSNHAAVRLYEKLGFYLVGMRRHYYSDPVEDGLVMCKSFSPSI